MKRNFIIWLCGLALTLSLVKCAAQVKTNSFYFTWKQGTNSFTTYGQAFLSSNAELLLQHTNEIALITLTTYPSVGSNGYATVQYWAGDTNAMLAPEAAEWMPYIPPPLTPEQQLVVSNKIWLRSHPAIVATPKTGALQKVNLVTKPPMP